MNEIMNDIVNEIKVCLFMIVLNIKHLPTHVV